MLSLFVAFSFSFMMKKNVHLFPLGGIAVLSSKFCMNYFLFGSFMIGVQNLGSVQLFSHGNMYKNCFNDPCPIKVNICTLYYTIECSHHDCSSGVSKLFQTLIQSLMPH